MKEPSSMPVWLETLREVIDNFDQMGHNPSVIA
jgi:hypothetical protein